MEVAKKLALVTKVGGGNGVNLDPYRSKGKRARRAVEGVAYLSAEHPDVEDFIRGLMRPPINPDGAKEEISSRTSPGWSTAPSPRSLRPWRSATGCGRSRSPRKGASSFPTTWGDH